MGAIAGESKITLLAASGAGDDGSLVCVVVVVEEVGGAVEREGGDWEVGETDEEERQGVADSAVAVERRIRSKQCCTHGKVLTVDTTCRQPWNRALSNISKFPAVF